MAWTAPRTWVAGETVTAALMNTHVRDNLKALGDPWTSYTPTLVGMTIGNGAVVAKYLSAGKFTVVRVWLTAGGTTAYTAAITISLPAAVAATAEQPGSGKLFTGAQDLLCVPIPNAGASTFLIRVPTSNVNGTLIQMSNTSPNPGTTGNLACVLTYEAA